jgi:hypothetical protein
MLKIKDATGEVVGVLKDEDSIPEMKKTVQETEELTKEAQEGEEDGDGNADDVNV